MRNVVEVDGPTGNNSIENPMNVGAQQLDNDRQRHAVADQAAHLPFDGKICRDFVRKHEMQGATKNDDTLWRPS